MSVLKDIFDDLNEEYFQNEVTISKIEWGEIEQADCAIKKTNVGEFSVWKSDDV